MSVNFKEGARLFSELANTYQKLTERKPKRFIPRGPGWTRKKQVEYSEKILAEHWKQNKVWEEICRNLAMACLGLDRLQSTIKNSIIM